MLKYLKKSLSRKLDTTTINKSIKYDGLLHNLKYILPSVKKHWVTGLVGAISLLVSSILLWPLPLIMKYFIDHVIITRSISLILPVVSIIVLLNGIIIVCNMLEKFFISKFSEEVILDIRQRVLIKVFSLPKTFFDKNHTGYINSRISHDIQGLKFFISGTAVRFFIDIAKLIGGIIFIFYLEWRIATPLVITIPIALAFTRFFARKSYAISHATIERNAELNASYIEAINNSRLIKSFNNEEQAVENIMQKAVKSIHILYESIALNVLSNSINKLMPSVAKIAVLIIGSYWVINGHWQLGTLLAYFIYLSYIYTPVTNLSSSITQLQVARANLDRISTILEMSPEENSDIGEYTTSLLGNIEFKGVTFFYEKNNIILKNLSFNIRQGEHWAIVGKSGIGKTTLVSLIMRFYQPQSGSIYYDGKNANSLNTKSLRKHIGYVSQNIELFSGTIIENLCYGRQNATIKEVIAAAKAANIHDFINALPLKYETLIEEGGGNFSVGQKQRIALARTLIQDADIIILDEPTSAQDTNNELSICNMIKDNFKDKTTFIIAHRIETIKVANNIILLRKNGDPLTGTFEDLRTEINS